MSNLTDEKVKEIAKVAATANSVNYESITTAPTFDSAGAEAIEITFVLTRGSSEAIRGERSARTVSQVIRDLADTGDKRFPIVRYEEKGAA